MCARKQLQMDSKIVCYVLTFEITFAEKFIQCRNFPQKTPRTHLQFHVFKHHFHISIQHMNSNSNNNCCITQSESKSVENRCYIFVQGDSIAFYGWIIAYTFPIITSSVAVAGFNFRCFALENFTNYRYQQPLDTPHGIMQTKFEPRKEEKIRNDKPKLHCIMNNTQINAKKFEFVGKQKKGKFPMWLVEKRESRATTSASNNGMDDSLFRPYLFEMAQAHFI